MEKSESIAELAKGLAKAQADFGPLLKGATNPFFKSKYADLSSVMDVARGPLAEHGLCFVQTTEGSDVGFIVVETTLIHTSGEWVSGKIKMPLVKNDPQGFGSAMTYARRYALQAILGLAAEDDDGEGVMPRGKDKREPKSTQSTSAPVSILAETIETFAKIDNLTHLANHFKKHFEEYKADPQFKKIVEAKDNRKAELAAKLEEHPDPDWAEGAGKPEPEPCITENEARDLQVLAEEVSADKDALLKHYGAKSFETFPAKYLKDACKKLAAKQHDNAA
jgi:hypothetical protein